MNIPAYIICLQKTRAKRCDPTYHAWKKVLPQTQRLTAITPHDFDLKKVVHPYALYNIQNKKRKTLEFIVSDKEVACAMSHIKAWQRIAQSNQASIVVEDDMAMSENNIRNMVNQLQNKPNDTEMYLLQFVGINLKSSALENGYISVHQFTGLQAYYLTPQGANKLLKNAFPILFQVDTYAAKAGLNVRSRKENKMSFFKFVKDNLRSTLGGNHISSTMLTIVIILGVLTVILIIMICVWVCWQRSIRHQLIDCQHKTQKNIKFISTRKYGQSLRSKKKK